MDQKNSLLLSPEVFERSTNKIQSTLETLERRNLEANVLVVGDVGLDEYLFGSVDRISPEAPVPVLKHLETNLKVGLSANVARNIGSLGGACDLFGFVGQDDEGQKVASILTESEGVSEKLVRLPGRQTTLKSRAMAGQHQLLRIDREDSSAFSSSEVNILREQLSALDWDSYSAVIIEDYNKGLVCESLVQRVLELASERDLKVFVDPARGVDPAKYRGAFLFKPNKAETLSFLGYKEPPRSDEEYAQFLGKIAETGSFQAVLSTLGAEGMMLFESMGTQIKVPSYAKDVFDVTGAGDTVIAALTLGYVAGLSLTEAALLANFAASYVVSQVGTSSCSPSDILTQMKKFPESRDLT